MSDKQNLQGIWTQYGHERMAAWLAGGEPLKITAGAVGNGGGVIPDVNPAQERLVDEEWRGLVNCVKLNPEDGTDVMVELVLPNDIGGFWIREWGLFDDAGKLVAVGPHDTQHKPLIASGQAAEILEIFHLPVSNSGAVSLTIASQALASQDFVQGEINKVGWRMEAIKEETDNAINEAREIAVTALATAKRALNLDYFLAWYIFKGIHPKALPGMVPVNGTLITNAAALHPDAFAYLQSPEGKMLCTTEAEWQAAHSAFWATLADGTKVGWDGIGGICKYVVDTNAGTIRVPDLRGMYDEVAGFDSLGVGGVHGDGVREIWGNVSGLLCQNASLSGALYNSRPWWVVTSTPGGNITLSGGPTDFSASRVVPTANKIQGRAWGALACVYLGAPK